MKQSDQVRMNTQEPNDQRYESRSYEQTKEKSKLPFQSALIRLNEILGFFSGWFWIDPCINESKTQVYQGCGSNGDTRGCGEAS